MAEINITLKCSYKPHEPFMSEIGLNFRKEQQKPFDNPLVAIITFYTFHLKDFWVTLSVKREDTSGILGNNPLDN